jgi:hypothetical protein
LKSWAPLSLNLALTSIQVRNRQAGAPQRRTLDVTVRTQGANDD